MLNTFANKEKDQHRRDKRQYHLAVMEDASKFDKYDDIEFVINQEELNLAAYFDDDSFSHINLQNINISDLIELEPQTRRISFVDKYKHCTNWILEKVKRKNCIIGGCIMLVFATMLVVFLNPTQNEKLNNIFAEITREDSERMIHEWITHIGVTSSADLLNDTSPQYQALQWMVNKDKITQEEIISIERYILAVLYFSTSGWQTSEKWLSDESVCSWWGVKCSLRADMIEELNLANNEMKGNLPSEITHLGGLRLMSFNNNMLHGAFPKEIGNLINLEILNMGKNRFQGTIPESIGSLKSIVAADLSSNLLSGSIPVFAGNHHTLETIDLHENELSGTIPNEIGNLSKLIALYFDDNLLQGTIPTTVGNLNNLVDLRLSKNTLRGSIPKEIMYIQTLRFLYLDHNDLVGNIPDNINFLRNLEELHLYRNSISRTIPSTIGLLSKLRSFYLEYNEVTGGIPSSIRNLRSLEHLSLSSNMLSGIIPSEIGETKSLVTLSLHHNGFRENVPSEIGGLMNLQQMHLHENDLRGSIPEDICLLREENLHEFATDCGGNDPSIECFCCTMCYE